MRVFSATTLQDEVNAATLASSGWTPPTVTFVGKYLNYPSQTTYASKKFEVFDYFSSSLAPNFICYFHKYFDISGAQTDTIATVVVPTREYLKTIDNSLIRVCLPMGLFTTRPLQLIVWGPLRLNESIRRWPLLFDINSYF
jgi:hypothetical protein